MITKKNLKNIKPVKHSFGKTFPLITRKESKKASLLLTEIKKEQRKTYHKKTTEIYFVMKGKGTVTIGKEKIRAGKGTILIIPPGKAHSVRPIIPMEILVISIPAWSKKDHFLVQEK